MRAVVYRAYGGPEVLELEDIRKPVPRDHEVRVKVFATTATAACGLMRRADNLTARLVLGLRRPRARFRVMGIELAGVVDRVGCKVSRFREGDSVFGFAGFSAGAYAEYVCISERGSLSRMPHRLTYEEAVSLVDGPTTALYFLRDRARIRPGDRVLIIGASGSIGTAAVQLARHFGAEVTAVCSGANAALVTSLGAHHVIDYTEQDFTTSDRRWDVVFDTVGKSSFSRCKRVLTDGGRYLVTVGPLLALYLRDAWSRLFGKKKLMFGMSVDKHEGLRLVSTLVESGQLRPVVDRRYALDEIAEAHRYVDTGRKKGNVVIQVAHG
jgi:NADPH2:quinone reductase